jgi:hypothetical protein
LTHPNIEAYVQELRRSLRRHFITDPRIVDEVREHLIEAYDEARERGDASTAAEHALARFGSPQLVAAAFVADRTRVVHRGLLIAACLAGIAIAYVDGLPTWNDTGVTAGAMTLAAGSLGLLGPQRPWLWALGVGVWIPVYAVLRHPSPAAAAMALVIGFPMAGAYMGHVARRWLLRISRAAY